MPDNVLSAKINVQLTPGSKAALASVASDASLANAALNKLGKEGALSIGGIENAIKQFKVALSTSTNPAEVQKLNTAIVALKGRLSDLNSGSVAAGRGAEHMGVGLQRASSSVLNLSKAFNILPPELAHVSHSFEQLFNVYEEVRANSTSTGSAIKSFGSLLAGPVGLGLAISIGVGLLSTFVAKLFETSEATKEAEEKTKKYKEALKGVFAETAKEATHVATLVGLLKSETETRERKLQAIKELQKIEPEIFASLKLEGTTVAGLDTAYQSYIQHLSTVIAVKIKQIQLEALITKQLELQGATLTKTQTDFIDKLKQQNNLRNNAGKFTLKTAEQQDRINSGLAISNKLAKEQAALEKDIAGIIADISELSKGVELPGTKDAKKVKEVAFEFDALKANFEKLLLIQKQFSRQLEQDSKVRFDIAANIGLDTLSTNFKPQAEKISSDIRKLIEDTTKRNGILKIAVDIEIEANAKTAKIKQTLDEFNRIIDEGIKGIVSDAVSSAAEGIGEALAGGDINKGIKSFLATLAGGIAALGKQLIAFGIKQKLALDAAKKFNPILTIAAGVALVVIGSAMRAALNKGVSGARALGGPVRAGGSYLVGERGPELFTPDTGGRIVANNQLSHSAGIQSGGMAVQVVGQLLLRGNDLVAALANANRSQTRLT
jgi:hypothetical protein